MIPPSHISNVQEKCVMTQFTHDTISQCHPSTTLTSGHMGALIIVPILILLAVAIAVFLWQRRRAAQLMAAKTDA